MLLKMYIGRVLVDQTTIEYEGMHTATERQQHGESIALDMYLRHYRRIRTAHEIPVFFIDRVPSRMNVKMQANKLLKVSYEKV